MQGRRVGERLLHVPECCKVEWVCTPVSPLHALLRGRFEPLVQLCKPRDEFPKEIGEGSERYHIVQCLWIRPISQRLDLAALHCLRSLADFKSQHGDTAPADFGLLQLELDLLRAGRLEEELKLVQVTLEDVIGCLVIVSAGGNGAIVHKDRCKLGAILVPQVAKHRICKPLEYARPLLRSEVQHLREQQAAAGDKSQQCSGLVRESDLGEAPDTVEGAMKYSCLSPPQARLCIGSWPGNVHCLAIDPPVVPHRSAEHALTALVNHKRRATP